MAKLTDVQHAFWVVLGTLSVLRTSATATGTTALRALAGTIAGFVVGGALLVGIGYYAHSALDSVLLAVLVAAYTPGTAPFVVGQAAFTVTIVVLFNLLVPAGWQVGLLRVEDVAIGCAVSLVVGFLFRSRACPPSSATICHAFSAAVQATRESGGAGRSAAASTGPIAQSSRSPQAAGWTTRSAAI